MSQSADLRQVMDQIAAGRTSDLTCPFCKRAKLKKEWGDYGPQFACPACHKFIEAPSEE